MSALLTILALLFTLHFDFTVGHIGLVYGRNADNFILSQSQVVEVYKKNCIHHMRIYEAREDILEALRGSNIKLTMSIMNAELPDIAASQANADAWVNKYIKAYANAPGVAFSNIVIGNEISPSSENSQYVLQVMKNVDTAISAAGLGGQIKVTTSIASDLMKDPFPPETTRFKDEVIDYMRPIISFVASKGASLMASIYPGISYSNSPAGDMDIEYALLDPSYSGVKTIYGNTYQNLFFALIDNVNAAVEDVLKTSPHADADAVQKGNPGSGGGESNLRGIKRKKPPPDDESTDYTQIYIRNLINLIKSGRGTPLNPKHPILTYVFAAFDENLKPGDDEERHLGIFNLDGTKKFSFSFC